MSPKDIPQDYSQASAHIPFAIVWNQRIVAEIARTKRTTDYFINVDETCKCVIFGNNPVTQVSFASGSS